MTWNDYGVKWMDLAGRLAIQNREANAKMFEGINSGLDTYNQWKENDAKRKADFGLQTLAGTQAMDRTSSENAAALSRQTAADLAAGNRSAAGDKEANWRQKYSSDTSLEIAKLDAEMARLKATDADKEKILEYWKTLKEDKLSPSQAWFDPATQAFDTNRFATEMKAQGVDITKITGLSPEDLAKAYLYKKNKDSIDQYISGLTDNKTIQTGLKNLFESVYGAYGDPLTKNFVDPTPVVVPSGKPVTKGQMMKAVWDNYGAYTKELKLGGPVAWLSDMAMVASGGQPLFQKYYPQFFGDTNVVALSDAGSASDSTSGGESANMGLQNLLQRFQLALITQYPDGVPEEWKSDYATLSNAVQTGSPDAMAKAQEAWKKGLANFK